MLNNSKNIMQHHFKQIVDQAARQSLPLSAFNKIRLLSLNNLIINTIDIIRLFILNPAQHTFSAFLVKYFADKFVNKNQCCHALSTHLHSWRKHLEVSLESRLQLSLTESKTQLKMYLRIRKEIIKINSLEILDNINLAHQETIAIIHRQFDETKRKYLAKKFNQYYININSKLINNVKLQACVFVQFLLSHISKLHTLNEEVRITQQVRKNQENQFNSRIDEQNGLVSPRKEKDSLMKSKATHSHELNSNKKIVQSRLQDFKAHNSDSNELVKRFFATGSALKIEEKSPQRLFQTAEKSLNTLNRIDQILDSRRKIDYSRKQEVSSFLNDKYNQDWSRMLMVNENFKQKMLKKTKEQLENNEGHRNLQTFTNHLRHRQVKQIQEDHQFSFQEEKEQIPAVRQSIVNNHKQFQS